ncbi:hypothetical protein CPB84DRAFT_666352 [Gymnopilus junonius]|uniref:Uncharacterized protein n=1 Tax=Gymnopilus junonius TaxID=109634 RepID=A0A9P5TQ05_GYMJU|nr:hypothetical protein CPB84DRAFT_666352 [Gymnopilus junonius]
MNSSSRICSMRIQKCIMLLMVWKVMGIAPWNIQKRNRSSKDKDSKSVETPRLQSRRSPSSQSSSKSTRATPKHYGINEAEESSEPEYNWDTPHPQSHTSGHARTYFEKPSPQLPVQVAGNEERSSSRRRSNSLQSPQPNRSGQSPQPNFSQFRHQSMLHSRSASPAAPSAMSIDNDTSEVVHEREHNWNSPHPVWHNPSRPLSPLLRTESSRQRTNSSPASPHSREEKRSLSRNTSSASMKLTDSDVNKHRSSRHSISPQSPPPSGIPLSRSSSLQPSDNTYRHNDSSLLHPGRSISPLPSISKKRPASPSTSTTPRKQKTSTSSATKHVDTSLRMEEKNIYPENFLCHLARKVTARAWI